MAAVVTAFAPPAACASTYFGTLSGDTGPGLRRGVGCLAGTLTWEPDCYPTATPIGAGCPSGYETAFQWSSSAACCPRGYAHDGRTAGQTDCSSGLIANAWTALHCKAGAGVSTTTAKVSYVPIVFATPVIIRFPATTARTSSKTSSTLSSSTRPTISATSIPGRFNRKTKRIGKGAIAGIVLGALVALAVLMGAILFCLRRRKNKQKALIQPPQGQAYQQNLTTAYQQYPPAATDTSYYGHKAELAAPGPNTGQDVPLTKYAMTSQTPAPVELADGHAVPQNGHQSWMAPADQHGAQGYAYGQQGYAQDARATSPYANSQHAGAPEAQSLLQHTPYGSPEPARPTRPAELG